MEDLIFQEDCQICNGSGEAYVANGPDDFDVEVCSCGKEPKRFRASIYIDIIAENHGQARSIAEDVVKFLGNQEDNDLPEGYYNPYYGGTGEVTKDPIQTIKNLEHL